MEKIPFKIVHMDGLGQGVSKILDKPTFITKTLPEEEGVAIVTGQRKKVAFAQLTSSTDLQKCSPSRIPSECPHFDQCPGCHYLHTSYQMELQFKQEALKREFLKLKIAMQTPMIHAAEQRFTYRNRITLHYNKGQNSLGMASTLSDEILSIPNCRLPIPEIQKIVTEFYTANTWHNFDGPNQGHVEIYQHPTSGMHISVNLPYAQMGFSQVNQSMNQALTNWIAQQTSQCHFTDSAFIVDLFGGDGNLSKKIVSCSSIYVIDKYNLKATPRSNSTAQQFFSYDLYSAHDLRTLQKSVAKKIQTHHLELMILDPPRSGFTHLATLVAEWKPTHIFYVSCSPDTLMRDIKNLLPFYSIQCTHLFDMFPGTYHFETIVHLRRW
ncbi:MAG: class I SAM-dependent RNA methyltransferase [Bdellovibrio sp.]|nr:class I SAM-dependent RNA methyltransferase [Bdellovibrio sp.]